MIFLDLITYDYGKIYSCTNILLFLCENMHTYLSCNKFIYLCLFNTHLNLSCLVSTLSIIFEVFAKPIFNGYEIKTVLWNNELQSVEKGNIVKEMYM